MSYFKKNHFLLTGLVSAAISMTSFAQDSVIEEIVVTSSKRTTTLQEIPIAVSVTSADTIEKAQIIDLKDLQSVVPSLKINTLQNSTNTNFIIRGFGNGANNPGIEPSVGVFIDGVYRSRSASAISDLPNIERVEVLRGPQSTLFGKNASAGVISIVTRAPTGEFGGNVSATVASNNKLVLKGQVEGSISENVAFDLSASSNTADGYFDNLLTGGTLNDRDRKSVRGQLAINPSDETSIRIIADYDQIDEKCCGVNNLQVSATETFTNAVTGAQLIPNDPYALEGFYNLDPTNEIENSGISMQVSHDFSNFALTSITSFRNSDSGSIIDLDFSSADIAFNELSTEVDTITQEIRLTSTAGDNLDWMVGGYYFDESIDYVDDLPYGTDFRTLLDALSAGAGAPNALAGIEAAFGLPFGTFYNQNSGIRQESTLDNQAISLFGQIDWHLTDQLTATIGLNYTEDEKEATSVQVLNDAFGAIPLGLIGAGALSALQLFPTFQDFPNSIEDGKTNDDELTYTLRLAYDANDSISVYGGISTGFKATSWNLSRDSLPSAADLAALQAAGIALPNTISGTRFADPEQATVIELGLKSRFDRGSLNVAIFDQKIENFQSNIFTGTGFNLANAEEQSTVGIEFDLAYYPTDDLVINLAGTFLDPEYDSFSGASIVGGVGDLSGEIPSGIHETSLSIGATYNFVIGGNISAYVRGDYQYDDDIRTNDNIPADISREEFKNLNLSAGIETDSGLGVAIWGRNVTDHETTTTGFPTPAGTGGYFGYRNAPATYGLTIKKGF